MGCADSQLSWNANRKEGFALLQGLQHLSRKNLGRQDATLHIFSDIRIVVSFVQNEHVRSSPGVIEKRPLTRLNLAILKEVTHLRIRGLVIEISHLSGKLNYTCDALSKASLTVPKTDYCRSMGAAVMT